MPRKFDTPKATIFVDTLGGLYRWSNGAGSSRLEFKTFAGAVRAATRKGYEVTTTVDPMIEYRANEKRTKIVLNLISGKMVRIPFNSPLCCDPSSETYWSM